MGRFDMPTTHTPDLIEVARRERVLRDLADGLSRQIEPLIEQYYAQPFDPEYDCCWDDKYGDVDEWVKARLNIRASVNLTEDETYWLLDAGVFPARMERLDRLDLRYPDVVPQTSGPRP